MHTFSETGAGVPAFLAKLWRLVEDPETNHLICWSRDGRSFIIQNQAQFARELLPLNYKHNNMASFIRQLNMYGFHKITSIDNGGLKFDRDEMEFSHSYFKRGCPYLLEHIKRKIATTKTALDERAGMKPEAVNKVLNEVKLMRGRQDSLDSRFSVMKQENEALWREIASLRQKHMKQQQIVNKLIQFLVTMVQPSRNMSGVKRHFQLMINDAPQSSKVRKRSESDSGPVIRELTEELLEEVADSDAELLVSTSPNVLSPCDASIPIGSEMNDESNPKSGTNSDCPNSNPSVSSQHYDSNQSDENAMSGVPNNINITINTNNGNEIIYDISEVPDNTNDLENQIFEENVLNTPMVKQEMTRKQELYQKQKQKQRKRKESLIDLNQSNTPTTSKQQKLKTPIQCEGISNIKTEQDLDPLMFLDVSTDGHSETFDPSLISPNSNNSQSQSSIQDVKQMYNSGDFISADMPTDLFEESPMIGDINLASGSYNQNIDDKGQKCTSDNGRNTNPDSSGINQNTVNNSLTLAKYNSQKYPSDDDIMRLSTAEEFNTHLDSVQEDLENLKDILRGDNYSLDTNTLLGKNPTSTNRIVLSSPLDGDVLAKLFSDSDILAPYGLSLSNDNAQDNSKKGSELISYQPYYAADLSDILDINNVENLSKNSGISSKQK